jgi:eukaryotic-like serine/threonine-protein kinase
MTRVTAIGAYEVVHALKEGGMGEVLLARRRGPGGVEQLVAIKTIRAELAGAAAVRAMFLDEAGILARLTHPAVAAVHDFGDDGGALYLVMEYVAGIAFRELIDRRPPPAIAARAIALACRGVHAAHELRDRAGNALGVVHRDISPENLMLGHDGHVKVIDFGIALIKNRQAPVTEHGMLKGKPPYMSPEQVKNEPIDRQSDVFSLAVVLHELLTGHDLFTGESIFAVARAVELAPIAPPSTIAGPLPAGLDAAVMRGLDRDKARRTPTAAAFAEELEAVVMAAGGETLEAWAERELAEPARTHRAWLAELLDGAGGAGRIGRPTGAVTALPALPAPAPIIPSEHAPEPRRGRGTRAQLLAVLAAGVVAGLAAVWLLAGRCGSTPSAAPDARVVARVPIDAAVVTAPPPDAAAALPLPIDAAAAPDARDARDARPRRGATRPPAPPPDPPTVRPDAAPAAATGTGYLTCTSKPFATVSIDGVDAGTTPFFKRKVSAGRHRVVFTSPQTGEVVLDRMIEVAPGQTRVVAP